MAQRKKMENQLLRTAKQGLPLYGWVLNDLLLSTTVSDSDKIFRERMAGRWFKSELVSHFYTVNSAWIENLSISLKHCMP